MTELEMWADHVEKWKDCQLCPLSQQRSNICLARGLVPCTVLFIGEAPGLSEDAFGLPFKGPAGHLMDQIIDRALKGVVSYALTNLVACFPREAKSRGDNEPERGEILECRPRLIEFVNIAQPQLVVCVGGLANHYVQPINTMPQVDIVHPAYILARLPAAQKNMAVQKCIVQVSNALEDVLQSPKQFKQWGDDNAKGSKKEKLRKVYGQHPQQPNDEIPF